jgi:hypothetical protein
VEELTFGEFGAGQPDIGASGEKIVYDSSGDPLGTNPDNNLEIFLHDATAGTTEQLTMTTSGSNRSPRISPNGQYVIFGSDSPLVSTSLGEAVYRLELATGELRLASAGGAWVDWSNRTNGNIDVADDGSVAFVSSKDLGDRNHDRSYELWLAEFDAVPSVEPSVDAPTVVAWNPLPWALSYDVIRGNVANLAPGMGGTVDLGPVVCIEDDSDDATTFGFEDEVQPAPGEVLFYLHRGWGGDLVGDESWGEGTGEAERVPASGSCTDGS